MKDQSKTKQVLIQELVSLRHRISELERSESERKRVDKQILAAHERLQYLLSSTAVVIYAAKPSGEYGATFISENGAHLFSDLKKAEKSLRESEERYRTILENIEDGYFEVDIAGNFTFFNDSVRRMVGYTRAELMGMNNRRYTDKENRQILYQAFNKVFRTGEPSKGVGHEIIGKDGTKLYIESSVSLIRNTSGQPIGFRGIMRNITERKRMEEALQDTLDSLRKSISTTIQVMVSTVEARDPYTAGHQRRSANLARAIATEIGLLQDKIDAIRMAGSIHDIGKISIPAKILSKPA